MSEMTINKPMTATAFERAIEAALRVKNPDLAPVAALMNPDTCPAELLGWLAWSFSVDVWDPSWSEQIKRDVIKQSITIHRRKGTTGAVRRALSVIGFEFDISAWFEHDGPHHTFRVDAFADDIFDAGMAVSPQLVALVGRLIENVKQESAHFTLRVGERKGGPITMRAGSLQRAQEPRHIAPALPVDNHTPSLTTRAGHRPRAVSHQIHRFMGDVA